MELRPYYGFILAHHDEMTVFTNRHISAIEISIAKEALQNNELTSKSGFPRLGLSYLYSDLGNSEYLGYVNAMYPFADFTILKGNTASLQFRFGAGLSWFSKKFDLYNNYKNTAIGSNLNAAIAMNLNLKFKLSESLAFSAGLSFLHFSNGSTKMPNYGINVPTVNTAFLFKIRNKTIQQVQYSEAQSIIHKPEISFIGMAASKEIFPINGPKYLVGNLAIDGFIPITKMFKTGLCLDVSYDASDIEVLRRENIELKNNIFIIKYGANLAQGINLGNFSFTFHVGMYLHQMNHKNGNVYDKLSFTYAINKHYLMNVTLKTHYAKADFVAFGIGYRL
jgi:hypothetical protein